MVLGEALERISQQLENRAVYTAAEQCTTGVAPALLLLALTMPSYRTVTQVLTWPALTPLVNYADSFPRLVALRRVVVGQRWADRPVGVFGVEDILRRSTRQHLARRDPLWMTRTGTPRDWIRFGSQQMGLAPRPLSDTTVSLTGTALPATPDPNALNIELDCDPLMQPLVVDLATHFLLLKQGAGEAERGFQRLQQLLQTTALEGPLRQLRRMQAQAVAPALSGT